jgi:hypothetical protein
MGELDTVPQTSTVQIATVKLEEVTLNKITELNQQANASVNDLGQIHIRRKELNIELERLDSLVEKCEADFKETNLKLNEIIAELEEKYPAGRLNLQDGSITYQPGAPTKKQLAEQQAK